MSKQLHALLLFLILTIPYNSLFAQQRMISGTVYDKESNATLPGANILVKGTTTGTATDIDGKFTIQTDVNNPVLVIMYVGYKEIEMEINNQSNLEIHLEPDYSSLDEVVIVGYGTQKRANLTGAVGTVKSDAFKDRPITNASQALAGQASGVWINQTSGQPGADGASIRIRGIGTLGNSNPLVLVDGIVSSLNAINPNDIESITVLKDAASAAIYGSRAANGVILVETKKGKKGPLKVDIHSYIGNQKATVLPEMVTNSVEVMELYNQALANEGQPAHFSQATIDEYRNGTDPLIYPNNDWLNMIYRTAPIQENVVTLSGGKDETQYSVSLGYLNQKGILQKDHNKRYSMHFNLNSAVSESFDWGVRANLINAKRDQMYYISGPGATRELMRAMPFYGTYTPEGNYASTWVNSINAQFNNPLAIVNNGLNNTVSNSMLGNAYFNLKLLKGLTWNVTSGINYNDNFNRRFVPELYVYNPKTETRVSRIGNDPRNLNNAYNKTLLTTVYTTLTYNKVFAESHNLTVLGGFNQERYNGRSMSAYIEGFPSNNLQEINAGSSNKNVSGGSNDYGIRSVFGRANYSYKDKYLFEANLRYDGSSRFSGDERWGVFPAFSAGWRISEEDFMQNQSIFSNLKLRGSWGQLGNDQVGLYRWIPTLSLGADYFFNNTVFGGVAQTSLPNTAITWETATKSNIGFEAGFFEGRLQVEFDYFNEDREGILRNINIPWTVGALTPPAVNLADVNNKGWEFSTNYTTDINGLHVNAGFNVTHVKNEITSIPDPQIGFNLLQEGEAINAFYMWKSLGIFQSQEEIDNSPIPVGRTTAPGDLKFEDVSGPEGTPDGIIDANDRQVVGKPIPTWTYGINLSLNYKGIDFSVLAQGVADVESYAYSDEFIPFFNGAGVTTTWREGNTWTPDNTGADLPRLLRKNAPTWNYDANSFWLQDASYLRIKNIQVGYTLPSLSFTQKIGIETLRIYANAQNPFTFTKFEGLDPERSLTSTSGSQYPNTRIISGGINIRF